MTDFIIDTPNHKRWWLPDRVHSYNSFIYGDELSITVWNERKNTLVLRVPPISLNHPQWQDLAETAQALAEKRFAARTRVERQTSEYFRSYKR